VSSIKPKREWVPLDRLVRDPGLQMRASLPDGLTDPFTVERYREAILEGEEFPPVEAVSDDKTFWLFDGFQRAAAMDLAGKGSVECLVFSGSRPDALLRAIAANARHGLTRSVNDCRRALSTLIDTQDLLQKVLAHAKDQGGVHLALAATCCISKGLVYKVLEERSLRVMGGKLVKKRGLPERLILDDSCSTASASPSESSSETQPQPDASTPDPDKPTNANLSQTQDAADIRELERARTAVSSIWNACRKLSEGPFASHLLRCAANHRIPFSQEASSIANSSNEAPVQIGAWEPLGKIEAVLSDLAAVVCAGIETHD